MVSFSVIGIEKKNETEELDEAMIWKHTISD
jgi:hypothetical protein